MKITLYHTCDLHGSLRRPQALFLRRLRESTPDSLLLDGGDALGTGNLNPGVGGRSSNDILAEAGYDAIAMGNRETHLWWSALRRKLRGLACPVISSNLVDPLPPVVPSLTCTLGCGATVGLFALTPRMIRSRSLGARAATVTFDDPMESAIRSAASLRGAVDVLVCLCHLGRSFDRRLADSVPEIDIIIGGHDHTPGLPEGERRSKTLLARSDPYGTTVGAVELHIKGTEILAAARLIPLRKGGDTGRQARVGHPARDLPEV